jgi:hypothetical protein
MVKSKEGGEMRINSFVSYILIIVALFVFTQLPGIRNVTSLIGSTDNVVLRVALFVGLYAGFILCLVGLVFVTKKLKGIIQR